MGLFDFLRGRKASDPDELRRQLIDAASNPRALASLCRRHEAMLVEHAPGWSRVPEELRGDMDAMNGYAQMLIAVAQWLGERGHPELFDTITGKGGDNPISDTEARLGEARELMDQLRLEEALAVLEELSEQLEGLRGPGRDQFLPYLEGFRGECLFHLGRAREALDPLARALQACRHEGDEEGVTTYLRNAFEVHRYLGDGERAAVAAERLADHVEPMDEVAARRLRKRAALARAGEPRCRVVAVIADEEHELDELPDRLGEEPVRFVFVRDRVMLAPCSARLERGRELGTAGELEQAAAAFIEAAERDAHAPEPWYELAFTYSLLGRFQEAVDAYERTEELAPGWYHCREGGYVARLLADGTLPSELFGVLVELQDGDSGPEEKLAMADAALHAHADLSLLHLHRGIASSRLGRDEEAAACFRRGLEAELRNEAIETRLFGRLATVTDDPVERDRAIEEAVARDGDRVSGATARLLRRITTH